MKNRKMSIKNRFISLAFILFVVLSIFSMFLITMIRQLGDVSNQISNHPLEVSNAASYANVEVLRMHRDLKDIILATEEYEINILVDKISVAENEVYIALDTISYHIIGDEGDKLEKEARILFDEWKDIRSEIINEIRNGNQDKAIETTRNKGANHIQTLERKLVDLNQYALLKAEEIQTEAQMLRKSSELFTVMGVVAVFVIIALSIVWIGINVLGGINKLSDSMNDIIAGEDFSNILLQGNDELGALSRIFNELLQSISVQLWIKEGRGLLNNTLTGNLDLLKSIEEYVNHLREYADFLSVGYYHISNTQLYLMASDNRLKFMDKSYELGEHLVGECALFETQKSISFEDSIGMNLDETLPYREIIVMPIKYNDIVYGVLEVVKKNNNESGINELLKGSREDLGAFISAMVQRDEIDKLLEESMHSNELLTIRQVRLEENQEELEAANRELQEQRDLLDLKSTELERQNTELIHLREELVIKYKDLEELSLYRSQFLTNVSHELKTPLNSIIVLSTILEMNEASSLADKEREQISIIHKAGNELLHTINDILDLSKVESGNVEVYEEVFETNQFIEEFKLIYETLAINKGLSCTFEDQCKTQIYADKSKINHIITNFISNAIKFTKEGFIKVVMEKNDDINYPLKISVIDTGIGIAKNKLEIVFDEFVQSDGSISRLYGGTGLGLAICRNYTNLINGKILVDSKEGEGSSFVLLLPSICVLDEYNNQLHKQIEIEGSNYSNKNRLDKAHWNKKILICDDEPMNVFALSSMLEEIGITPIATLSGVEAIAAFEEHQDIDMVFMDYMMPELDGFATIEELKKNESFTDVPVAIITAASFNAREIEFIKKNLYSYITKPLIYNIIVDLINDKLKVLGR
jgi:signal transduction histidine kinase/CheY-like chemotaxis protein/HAMP domain-containing protein